jgi:hypothetical protein
MFYNFQFSNISFASKGKNAISYFCIGQVKQEKTTLLKTSSSKTIEKI